MSRPLSDATTERLARLVAELSLAGVTQRDIARRIGLSPNHFSAVKNGRHPLQRKTAEAIEREFGVRAAWLLDGEQPVSVWRDGDRLSLVMDILAGEPPTTTTTEAHGTTTTEAPEAQVRYVPACGECGGRVAPGRATCPHCGAVLRWPENGA